MSFPSWPAQSGCCGRGFEAGSIHPSNPVRSSLYPKYVGPTAASGDKSVQIASSDNVAHSSYGAGQQTLSARANGDTRENRTSERVTGPIRLYNA